MRLSLFGLKFYRLGKDNNSIYTLSDPSREKGGRKQSAD